MTIRAKPRVALAVICCGVYWSSLMAAEAPAGTGERLARAAMAMVSMAEFGNLGALDPDCSSSGFQAINTDQMVDKEIAPVMRDLVAYEGKSRDAAMAATLTDLKRMPQLQQAGVPFVWKLYYQKKDEAISVYGLPGACVALATMAQTVLHQRRLELRDIRALLQARK